MDNKTWKESGKHLPKFMRDFHDQKDLFKAISQAYRDSESNIVNWRDAQIYTIDCFLWFMASHGYTLQKSRKHVESYDIEASIQHAREIRNERFTKDLKKTMKDLREKEKKK